MDNIKPVIFPNKDGIQLFGMLHQPENNSQKRDAAIILLSPGVKMRVAPHRLYNEMSKHFVDMGFTVLRFDFYGLGDSGGDIREKYLADFYNSVQVGRYMDDTIASMDWMEAEYGFSKFILSGLCGGAITGLLTGPNDKRVDSLLALGIPVILDSTDIDHSRNMTGGQLDLMRKGYFIRLFNVKSWLRLLTFKSDYKIIWKALSQSVKNKKLLSKKQKNGKKDDVIKMEKNANNFNDHFPVAFFDMLKSSRKILFIFSGADRLHWEFEEKFSNPYHEKLVQYESLFEVYIVKDANHIFSYSKWKQDMLKHAASWLEKNYRSSRNPVDQQ